MELEPPSYRPCPRTQRRRRIPRCSQHPKVVRPHRQAKARLPVPVWMMGSRKRLQRRLRPLLARLQVKGERRVAIVKVERNGRVSTEDEGTVVCPQAMSEAAI